MSYISSNENRLYVGLEEDYAAVPETSAWRRIPAVRLQAQQRMEVPARKDKTGTRTFMGYPAGSRRYSQFDLRTYLTAWTDQSVEPGYGSLFRAALGGVVLQFAGGTIAGTTEGGTRLQFQGSHGLSAGQAVCVGGELRFVTTIPSATTADLNAPFTISPPAGAIASPTVTYKPGASLPSVSVFDCWSPMESLQRIITGGAVDQLSVEVNSDYHQFDFRGPAHSIVDDATFEEGQGGLTSFPNEPVDDGFEHTVIPGHLGQAWIGSGADRCFTLTRASVRVLNHVDTTAREFGASHLRSVSAAGREVLADFELYATTEAQSRSLYESVHQGSAVQMMLQLGEQPGQLFGLYMKSLASTAPKFDDTESRLRWQFNHCRAQGAGDDELVLAFA